MDILVIGMVVFLLCTFGARFISERALRTLAGEQKLALLNAFSGMRMYGLLWAAGLLIVMFLLPMAFPDDPRIGLYIGLVLAVIFIVVRLVMTSRKIKALDLDPEYTRQLGIAQLISMVGMAIVIASVVFGTL